MYRLISILALGMLLLTTLGCSEEANPIPLITWKPLQICTVDVPDDPWLKRTVKHLPHVWSYDKKPLVALVDENCEAIVRFTTDPAPLIGHDYIPATAVSGNPPVVTIYRDGWVGSIAGAAPIVLQHEVGHLLCLTHSTNDNGDSVMRKSIVNELGVPQPGIVTANNKAEASHLRSLRCVGPRAEP